MRAARLFPVLFVIVASTWVARVWGLDPLPSGGKGGLSGRPAAGGEEGSPFGEEARGSAGLGTRGGRGLLYDLQLRLEVAGWMRILSRHRYYRSEDLHLKLEARPCAEGWAFRSIGLVSEDGEINFGIGEGPREHQRYVLFDARPAPGVESGIEKRIRRLEAARGCSVREKGRKGEPSQRGLVQKRAYFNYYLWRNPTGSFGFVLSPRGDILSVENRAEIEILAKPGGRRAKPRFFETLAYALASITPYADSGGAVTGVSAPVQWQRGCDGILRGLVRFCKGVYGRKMTLLRAEDLASLEVSYHAYRMGGSPVLKIEGGFSGPRGTMVRISGFKGRLWIESFSRETYLDLDRRRVLKDTIDVSFGIERKKKILAITGSRNRVRISLADECFVSCPDRDDAVLMAWRRCDGVYPGM